MSRSTQYIGLNHNALKWLRNANAIQIDNIEHFTLGMFEEEVPLDTYILPDGSYVYEVVQYVPWSSGPMIFTCLCTSPVMSETNQAQGFCMWIEGNENDREYNPVTGRFYV